MNFYDSKNFEAVVEFVNFSLLSNGNAAYLKSFASIDWAGLSQGSYGDLTTLERAKIAFYGLLYQYGIKASSFGSQGIPFVWDDELYDEFIKNNRGSRVVKRNKKYVVENPETASKIFKFMVGKTSWDKRKDQSETPFKIISEVDKYSVGKAAIRGISDFHSENSEGKVEEAIWRDMESGVISIVDLSLGDSAVTTVISEKIVNHLLAEANSRFRNGHEAVPFQIIVEEAHNLFERGAKDTISNPWVRLSKEAAKYKIGLIYATQEVTSVDSRILANTSNWLVAHLNSDKETRELSHYYDYKTWAESLRRIEDQGFVRMKTYSGKYIVPVQINKFDHSMINKARESNGLAKIEME